MEHERQGVLSREEILAAERAVNERYRAQCVADDQRAAQAAGTVSDHANSRFLGKGPKGTRRLRFEEPLAGRFSLEDMSDGVGPRVLSFYIGDQHVEWEAADGRETVVVSWAAPIAQIFYRRVSADDEVARLLGVDPAPGVAARYFIGTRTFDRHLQNIKRFSDELVVSDPPPELAFPLPTAQASAIPTAPRPVKRPKRRAKTDEGRPVGTARTTDRPGPQAEKGMEDALSAVEAPTADLVHSSSRGERATVSRQEGSQSALAAQAPVTTLRAEDIVRSTVARPRTGKLGSLIATLQEDQYDLVTWDPSRSLVVEGGPGTGKTIIATHRAAYLIHRDPEAPNLGRVALIGPTLEWKAHVSASLVALGADPQRFEVVSLPDRLAEMSGVNLTQMHDGRESYLDGDRRLDGFFESVIRELKDQRRGRKPLKVADVVKAVTSPNPAMKRRVSSIEDLDEWLAEARSWETVRTRRRYLPALAAIGTHLESDSQPAKFDHILVDEAQDITRLEWRLICRWQKADTEMTLVGDLNQRRSDYATNNWVDLANYLEMTDADGNVEVRSVDLAYRSTRRILQYANGLLGSGPSLPGCLRDGENPIERKTTRDELAGAVREEAERLAGKHPSGLVAVIALEPRRISDEFRSAGWKRPLELHHGWERDDRRVQVLHPDNARGLEFDGVVVVEPDDFRGNLGRNGVLYTSLTRATKDLMVVHSKRLPKELRLPRD